jgi:hypothetical protein
VAITSLIWRSQDGECQVESLLKICGALRKSAQLRQGRSWRAKGNTAYRASMDCLKISKFDCVALTNVGGKLPTTPAKLENCTNRS